MAMHRNSIKFLAVTALCLAMLAGALEGCGKPIEAEPSGSTDAPTVRGGVAGFGSQCPGGQIEEPVAVALDTSSCPLGSGRLELAQPLQPLMLMADCRNKNLTARTADRRVDNTFETKPDGSFDFVMNAGYAVMKNGCRAPLDVELVGVAECPNLSNPNYDRMDIHVNAFWTLRTPTTSSSGSSSTSGTASASASTCSLPPSCTFYATTVVHQCQR
jgi:hypothetical protein